jgi:hypothetical protein
VQIEYSLCVIGIKTAAAAVVATFIILNTRPEYKRVGVVVLLAKAVPHRYIAPDNMGNSRRDSIHESSASVVPKT